MQQKHKCPWCPSNWRINQRQQGGITAHRNRERFTTIQGQLWRPEGVSQGLEIGADPGPALLKNRGCQGGLPQAATFLPTPMLRSSVSRPLSTALASPKTMAVWGSSNRAFLIPA